MEQKKFWFLFVMFLIFLGVFLLDSYVWRFFFSEGVNLLQFPFGMFGLMFGFYMVYWFGLLTGKREGYEVGLLEGYERGLNNA